MTNDLLGDGFPLRVITAVLLTRFIGVAAGESPSTAVHGPRDDS